MNIILSVPCTVTPARDLSGLWPFSTAAKQSRQNLVSLVHFLFIWIGCWIVALLTPLQTPCGGIESFSAGFLPFESFYETQNLDPPSAAARAGVDCADHPLKVLPRAGMHRPWCPSSHAVSPCSGPLTRLPASPGGKAQCLLAHFCLCGDVHLRGVCVHRCLCASVFVCIVVCVHRCLCASLCA